jgi:hypothetical protein
MALESPPTLLCSGYGRLLLLCWGETMSLNWASNRPFVHTSGIWVSMEQQWNDIDRERRKNSEKILAQCCKSPPQIPHVLACARTRASAVKNRRLAAQRVPYQVTDRLPWSSTDVRSPLYSSCGRICNLLAVAASRLGNVVFNLSKDAVTTVTTAQVK